MAQISPPNRILNFLKPFKCTEEDKKEKKLTHTWFGGGRMIITYKVPKDKYQELYDLVEQEAFVNKRDVHLIERFTNPSILKIDLDFEFVYDTKNRVYTDELVKDVIRVYNRVITTYTDAPVDKIDAFVFERTRGYHSNGKYKDGLHIMYPELLLSVELQKLLRVKFLETGAKIFDKLKLTNKNLSDVVDESIIDRNGWMMYGSTKPQRKPYLLTHIYDYHLEEVDNTRTNRELVEYLSIHNMDIRTMFDVKPSKKQELETFKKPKSTNKVAIAKKMGDRFKIPLKRRRANSGEDLDTIKKLVDLLSDYRAFEHKQWIEVGLCLFNIDDSLLDTWIEFSKRAPSKFTPGVCEEKWLMFQRRTEDVVGVGSLHRWAMLDDPIGYEDVKRGSLSNYIEHSMNGQSTPIAKVVYEMFKYQYVCTSVKHNTWYEFRNHRWHEIEAGIELKKKLSNEVLNEYLAMTGIYSSRAMEMSGQNKQPYIDNTKKLLEVTLKLQDITFKDKVMKECVTLFYDKDFVEKLDSKPNLVCFENGVYDLFNFEFRDGRPEDYCSLSTNNDFIEYDMDDEDIQGVKTFMEQIFPIKDVRNYVYTILASFLLGKNPHEKFHVWVGCHQKNTPIMMSDGSIKMVQDIKVGEHLMGDDSTPRRVNRLCRGHSDMYRIVPNKGEPYVVNGDHILCLQAGEKMGGVYWNRQENAYEVTWHERNENGYPTQKYKKFAVSEQEETKLVADMYLMKMKKESGMIKTGDIIEIPVREYLKLESKGILKSNEYFGYRVAVDYKEQHIDTDPYEIGYSFGCGKLERIPEKYRINSREIRMKLLKGLLDSNINHKDENTKNEFTMKSEQMIDDIINLSRSLGFECYKSRINENDYRTTIEMNDEEEDALRYGFKIEQVEDDDYYGFGISGNRRYLMGDFTVTHNSGGNGKSKLIELYSKCFGGYAGQLPISLLTQKRAGSSQASPEVAQCRGQRFIQMAEPDRGQRMNIGYMKELTGGDIIQARPLYKEPFKFKPQFKIVLCCNDLPKVPPDDEGSWRRIRVVKFISKFVSNPDPKKKYQFPIDPYLADKLDRWKEAFMYILLEHYKKTVSSDGSIKIKEPDEVKEATKDYQRIADIYVDFLDENIRKGKETDFIKLEEFHFRFKSWYSQNYGGHADNQKTFRLHMERKLGPYTARGWGGIKLKDRFNQDESDNENESDNESVVDSSNIDFEEAGDDPVVNIETPAVDLNDQQQDDENSLVSDISEANSGRKLRLNVAGKRKRRRIISIREERTEQKKDETINNSEQKKDNNDIVDSEEQNRDDNSKQIKLKLQKTTTDQKKSKLKIPRRKD